MTPYEEGFKACQEGFPWASNPYRHAGQNIFDARSWERGWTDSYMKQHHGTLTGKQS